MQHRSIFQHNTVLLASIIVQLGESTVYSLHWHHSDIQIIIVPKSDTQTHAVASLVYFWPVALKHYSCTPGLALGSKVKSHYIIERNVNIIQLLPEA